MKAPFRTVAAAGRSRKFRLVEYFSFPRVPGQMPELDGLRGIAVILVLLRHAAVPFLDNGERSALGWDATTFMANGWTGVDLFFVLSGLLITHHILRQHDRNDGSWTWEPYLVKRALRILPAYYTVLLLVVVGAFPYFSVAPESLGPRVIYHLLLLQDYLPANIVVAFWSLGVEEKFYILAPFLVLGRTNAHRMSGSMSTIIVLLLVGIALRVRAAIVAPDIIAYDAFFYTFRSPFHMTMDPILLGMLIALIHRSQHHFPILTSRPIARVFFWVGVLLFLSLSCSHDMMSEIGWWDRTLQPTAIALSFAAITFGLVFGGGPGALFRTTGLFVTARISYALYLVHMPLIPLSLILTEQLMPRSFPVFIAVYGAASIIAATALHFSVEKPFLMLKDRVLA